MILRTLQAQRMSECTTWESRIANLQRKPKLFFSFFLDSFYLFHGLDTLKFAVPLAGIASKEIPFVRADYTSVLVFLVTVFVIAWLPAFAHSLFRFRCLGPCLCWPIVLFSSVFVLRSCQPVLVKWDTPFLGIFHEIVVDPFCRKQATTTTEKDDTQSFQGNYPWLSSCRPRTFGMKPKWSHAASLSGILEPDGQFWIESGSVVFPNQRCPYQ